MAATPSDNMSRETSEFEFIADSNPKSTTVSSSSTTQPAEIVDNVESSTVSPTVATNQIAYDEPTSSPTDTTITAENESGSSLIEWLINDRGKQLVDQISASTRQSVTTVITTLDPQMKEVIRSGGQPFITVASHDDALVSAVRRAFQDVLGQATVDGVTGSHPVDLSTIAEQPVGFAAGRQGALERANKVRNRFPAVHTVVSFQDFLYETAEDSWVNMICLVLAHKEPSSDPSKARTVTSLTSYSQPIEIESSTVQVADSSTPESYPRRWSGFAVNVGTNILGPQNMTEFGHDDWRLQLSGISHANMIYQAAVVLATNFQRRCT